MNAYENAPATLLVATHCCCCGRKLLCSESVRTGIGPVCAEKMGVAQELRGTEECKASNKLVYALAAEQKNWNRVVELLAELRKLPNFGVLAEKIEKRLTPKTEIEISIVNGLIKVVAPFVKESIPAFRNIPGRRFETEKVEGKEVKFNTVPLTKNNKESVFKLLKNYYMGAFVKGPKGIFQVAA